MHFDRRKSGLSLIGDLPWGSHVCQFYENPKDLLEILVPYFKAGLKNNEACLWVIPAPLGIATARKALKKAVPPLADYESKGQMEMISSSRWHARGAKPGKAAASRLDRAFSRGFDGLRLACPALPDKKGGEAFVCPGVDAIDGHDILALYAYPRGRFSAMGMMEVVRGHRFALVRNAGKWEAIESSEARAVKASLRRSEEKLQSVFRNMSEGFAYHRLVRDGRGRPCDYVFLEVNDAFARLTGLQSKDVVGRRATEVLPGIAEDPADWIGRYGKVAQSGKPVSFESYSVALKRWYAVSAFSSRRGYFAVTLSDITSRKQAEAALAKSSQGVRKKLESLISPEGDIGGLELSEIIDSSAIQKMMDDFHALARIPMAVIDDKGTVLVGVGWQDICTKFHRVHPEACRNCVESDTQLSAGTPPGEYRLYKCKNNLWDVATPIIVGGQRVGNVFSGQFFFDDESPDRELFRRQAARYGFPEAEYLAALDRVPRLSRAQVDAAMGFFLKLAQTISQLSWSNIQIARESVERRRAEREALQAKKEWELTFDSVPDLIAIIDEHHRVMRVNAAMARRLGREPAQCVGLPCHKAVHGLGAPPAFCPHSRTLSDGCPHAEEVSEERLGGDFLVATTPLRDASGRLVGSVHVAHDITERKRKDAELQQLNKTLRALSRSDQALVHAQSEQGYLDEVCRIVVEDCGHAMAWIGFAEQDEARTVRPAASAGFEEGYLKALRVTWADTEHGRGPTGTAIRTGQPTVCRNMQTDPAFRPWRAEALRRGYASSLVLPLSEKGKAFGAINIYSREPDPFTEQETRLLAEFAGNLAQGITMLRLRAANARAEEARGRLAAIVSSSDDAIIAKTLDGVITAWNAGAERLYGYRAQEAVGEHISILLPPGHEDEVPAALERSARGEAIPPFETLRRTKDGRVIDVALNISPVKDVQGLVVGASTIARDISERKRLEGADRRQAEEIRAYAERLAAANRELEAFSYSVSHDLRAPLRHINGFVDLLGRKAAPALDEPSRRYLGLISESAVRMGNLIDDLIAFSCIGRSALRLSTVDLGALVRQVQREVSNDAKGRDIAWTISELPAVTADRALLRVVLTNLLSNAVKFTRQRECARIEVGARAAEAGGVEVWVRDNGAGFDMLYADKLFGVFQRLHRSEEFEGTGIGLATVQRIIARHDGTVRAEGVPGEGAAFYFSLPSA